MAKGAGKTYRIRQELTPDSEIASYANNVTVSGGAHELVLTFFQIVLPVTAGDALPDSLPARPVARVALPQQVARDMADIIISALGSGKGPSK